MRARDLARNRQAVLAIALEGDTRVGPLCLVLCFNIWDYTYSPGDYMYSVDQTRH
jgi:hypothetical protein